MLFDLASAEEIGKALAQRLRALRLQQALSQAELAARAGVSPRSLRNLELSGQATLETFLRIAQALGRVADLENVFELKIHSIRALEAASKERQRAPKRRAGTARTTPRAGNP
jgi:transcriptional regulator with XRE-family HTH domain